jgi:hypothetical protein
MHLGLMSIRNAVPDFRNQPGAASHLVLWITDSG